MGHHVKISSDKRSGQTPPTPASAAGPQSQKRDPPTADEIGFVNATYSLEQNGMIAFGIGGQMKCFYEMGITGKLQASSRDRALVEDLARNGYKVPIKF